MLRTTMLLLLSFIGYGPLFGMNFSDYELEYKKDTVIALKLPGIEVKHESIEIGNWKESNKGAKDTQESLLLYMQEHYIGDIIYSIYAIEEPKHIFAKIIEPLFIDIDSKFNGTHCSALFFFLKKYKNIVYLPILHIDGAYQRNGFGKKFFNYFLNRLKNAHDDYIVLFIPAEGFDMKKNIEKLNFYELQKKLVKFYESFGAKRLPYFNSWMYIDFKKE